MKSFCRYPLAASLFALSALATAQSSSNWNRVDEAVRPAMRSGSGAPAGEGPGAMTSGGPLTLDTVNPSNQSGMGNRIERDVIILVPAQPQPSSADMPSSSGSSMGSGSSQGSGSSVGSGSSPGTGSSIGNGSSSGSGTSVDSGSSSGTAQPSQPR